MFFSELAVAGGVLPVVSHELHQPDIGQTALAHLAVFQPTPGLITMPGTSSENFGSVDWPTPPPPSK